MDDLTDDEILADLQTYRPASASSERNIWAFWDRGLAACPAWCRRNVAGWARRHSALGWTVRVLDMVPGSPNHFSRFVPATTDWFPAAMLSAATTTTAEGEGAGAGAGAGVGASGLDGTHAAPHAADLLRLPLLLLHGGVWLDVGFLLFRSLDSLCWDALADRNHPAELAGFRMTVPNGDGDKRDGEEEEDGTEWSMVWNGFIAARRGCEAVRAWHDVFLRVWTGTSLPGDNDNGIGDGGADGHGHGHGRTSTAGLWRSPLLAHLPRYEVPPPPGERPAFAYEAYVDYLIHMFWFERARHCRDAGRGWDGPAWFGGGAAGGESKALLFDCAREVYWAQALTGWDGRRQFELLSRERDSDDREKDEDEAGRRKQEEKKKKPEEWWDEAEAFVDAILATSATMKVSHGIATDRREYLARIWDDPRHAGADCRPGTFAARLRRAAVRHEDNRDLEPLDLPLRRAALLEGDLLEAVGRRHPHWDR